MILLKYMFLLLIIRCQVQPHTIYFHVLQLKYKRKYKSPLFQTDLFARSIIVRAQKFMCKMYFMENLLHAYVVDNKKNYCMDCHFPTTDEARTGHKCACKYYCMDYHFPIADEAGKGQM